VLTYNILANAFANPGTYYYLKDEHLNSEYRRELLYKDIEKLNSDIICLQEIERPTYEFLNQKIRS
jgi:mRNA deadenylase 3'-5' endonuclease subunit Ccr4